MPAITTKDVQKRGLALHVFQSKENNQYVLYDANQLLDYYKHHDGDIENLKHSLLLNMVAMMITKQPEGNAHGAREVSVSAALKGYGPLIYDIAISYDGLIPDRNNVSRDAKKIWSRYFERPDVDHKQLDNISNPKTKPTNDDAEINWDDDGDFDSYLNQAYFIENAPNVSKLINNDKAVQKRIKELNHDLISNVATKFFLRRMMQL